MAIREAMLPEFDREMAITRKVLERVPGDKLGWKPHEKSGTMLWLAGHVANIPTWTVITINQDVLDIGGPFDIPESQLTGMIQRVMDAERAGAATVH